MVVRHETGEIKCSKGISPLGLQNGTSRDTAKTTCIQEKETWENY